MTTGSREKATKRAWLAIALIGIAGFVLVTGLVASRTVIPFDQPLLDLGHGWMGYADVWNLLSNASNLPLIGLGVGIVLWMLWKHRHREAIVVIVVLAAVTAGSEAVKLLVARPRPPGFDTAIPGVVYSYPSGHVLEALTICGIIAMVVWRSAQPRWLRAGLAIVVAIFVALVAVARVALNAHYPSDVLGGFLAGVAVLALFALMTNQRRDAPTAPSG
ncbi:MAG: phosphatase PAP2 family protein [Candidatus Limnocylindrales bacterium]